MSRPARIVDAHVHLWDPDRTDWYPYLAHMPGAARRFDVATYQAEAGPWNVEKLVNVAAATGSHSVAETLHLDRLADPPAAIVGGLPPGDALAAIDEQAAAARFRGVRPMGATAPPVPDDDVLGALADRNLVFDLMAHPDQLEEAAHRLAAHPELTVVVEHAGWPRSTDDEERATWLAGLRALAAAGPHVACKLSGLAMPLGEVSAAAFRPWIEPAIELFGAERCLFASNFPVDGAHGSLEQLWAAYAEVTDGLDTADVERLYATNAERLYRC